MGKESRRRDGAKIQDMLGAPASGAEGQEDRARYPAGELAESFRKASKALEVATRDVVALRHRVTKPPAS